MPGRKFIRSEVYPTTALVASTPVLVDLGVNGLSHLFFGVSAKQNAANTPVTVAQMLNAVGLVEVLFNGSAIISAYARDLAVLGTLISGWPAIHRSQAQAGNAEVFAAFCVPFGRQLYGPNEGFPAVQRGTLECRVTPAAAFTGLASVLLNIQQVELPGNAFKRVNKFTYRQQTPAATGQNFQPLPIGNWLRGLLMFGTTLYSDYSAPGDVNQFALLVNNVETLEVGGDASYNRWCAEASNRYHASTMEHAHLENTAAMYAQNASTGANQIAGASLAQNYMFVNLDPTQDDSCSLDTKGLSDLQLMFNVNTSGEILRFLPFESVEIGAQFGK